MGGNFQDASFKSLLWILLLELLHHIQCLVCARFRSKSSRECLAAREFQREVTAGRFVECVEDEGSAAVPPVPG